MRMYNLLTTLAVVSVVMIAGCQKEDPAPASQSVKAPKAKVVVQATAPVVGSSTFAVLGATTVTNDGASLINGDLGVSPGTAITGFDLSANTIVGPGTVTAGLGIVTGTIYAGGPVAAQAHNDAVILYNYLVAQVPDTTYAGVTQLDGLTFTPGVYNFAPSANLQVNGTVYLDFQGNNDAVFIFQMGSTLVTMAGSKVIALNNNDQTCFGSNVYWAVGSSATVDGNQFVGSVVAYTTITMTSGANVAGRIWALNGAVTMIADTISVCAGGNDTIPPPKPCRDFVTGGGWIKGDCGNKHHKDNRATFGVSGGIKNGKFWGQLSYNDHSKHSFRVKSTKVTAYIIIDPVTRQIEGIAKINGRGSYTYKVIVVDNGEPGRNIDSFSLELSNGYTASGILKGGNIQIHTKCGNSHHGDKDDYHDKDENDGNHDCDDDDD